MKTSNVAVIWSMVKVELAATRNMNVSASQAELMGGVRRVAGEVLPADEWTMGADECELEPWMFDHALLWLEVPNTNENDAADIDALMKLWAVATAFLVNVNG